MEVYAKDLKVGRCYQLGSGIGVSLSTTKLYSVLLLFGYVSSYGEKVNTLSFKEVIQFTEEDIHYKIIINLNCWDILRLLENGYNDDDEIGYIIYGPPEKMDSNIHNLPETDSHSV